MDQVVLAKPLRTTARASRLRPPGFWNFEERWITAESCPSLVTPPRGLGVDRGGQQGPSRGPRVCCVALGRALSSVRLFCHLYLRELSSSERTADFLEASPRLL